MDYLSVGSVGPLIDTARSGALAVLAEHLAAVLERDAVGTPQHQLEALAGKRVVAGARQLRTVPVSTL
jgi:hypothetical protein